LAAHGWYDLMVNLRIVSIAVAVAVAMLGAVLIADPESLGISPVAARWLGIVAVGLGLLQTFLPRAQGPTKDPEVLAERVWDLPPDERQKVARNLADRASREQRVRVVGFFDSGSPVPVPDEERHAQ
jgi:hypothetical protein